MSDLDALRAKYKEVVGKNAFNGWDAAELQAKIDAASAPPKPADAPVAEPEKPTREPRGKSREVSATSSDPYPSQADLDAMRSGTYVNRELKSR